MTKDYLLKEYGSWSILVVSFVAGIVVSGGPEPLLIPLFLALALLVNSKQAFTSLLRRKEKWKPFMVFLVQVAVSSLLFIGIFRTEIVALLPLAALPAVYPVLFITKGEHFLLTEIAGFSLLSLSAVIAKFGVTGEVDYVLFICVALYFIAGVFKVRTQFRKRIFERVSMLVYITVASLIVFFMERPLILFLPLAENIVYAFTLYKVRLAVTGWVEVLKSILFLLLLSSFY